MKCKWIRVLAVALFMSTLFLAGCQTDKPSPSNETTKSTSQEEVTTGTNGSQTESDNLLSGITICGKTLDKFVIVADLASNSVATQLQQVIKNCTGATIIPLTTEENKANFNKYSQLILLTLPANGYTLKLERNEVAYYEENGNFNIILGSRDIKESDAVDYFLTEILSLNENYTSLTKTEKVDLTGFSKTVTLTPDPVLKAASDKALLAKTEIISSENHFSASDVTGSGKCYYVSNKGNDSNDGLTPQTAWATLTKVSGFSFPAGSVVLFERGGLWRGQLTIKSNGVIFSSYGTGEKPKIYGSVRNAAELGTWKTTETANVWRYSVASQIDIGNIVFDDGVAFGYKKYPGEKELPFGGTTAELKQNYQFWHDHNTGFVYLYYDGGNPSDCFDSIEFCVTTNLVHASNGADLDGKGQKVENIIFDNFCLKYGGAHGFSAINAFNVKVQYCEIGWIGGGIYAGTETSRYGNGIQVAKYCDGFYADHNYVYQCFDAGISHQYDNRSSSEKIPATEKNIGYTNNVVEYCFYNIEYFIEMKDETLRKMENVEISSNYLMYAGFGFGYWRKASSRPAATNVKGWNHEKPDYLDGYFKIENNEMILSRHLITETVCHDEDELPIYQNNHFVQYDGNLGVLIGMEYPAVAKWPKWVESDLKQNTYLKDKGNIFDTIQ